VTTFNEELPAENWRIPDPHPSAVRATTVDNRDNDYHRLVNTVERHTRCSPAFCLKQKRVDLLAEFRFGFPKPLGTGHKVCVRGGGWRVFQNSTIKFGTPLPRSIGKYLIPPPQRR
jgi:hypothetical protein